MHRLPLAEGERDREAQKAGSTALVRMPREDYPDPQDERGKGGRGATCIHHMKGLKRSTSR